MAYSLQDRIRLAREKAGFASLGRAAQAMSLARETLWRYENGDRIPGADPLRELCQVYRVSPVWLLGLGGVSFRRMR